MKRMGFLAVFFLSICSCLVYQPRHAKDLYVEPGYGQIIQKAELVLDSLRVQKGFDSQALEENAAYILRLMLEQRNQNSGHAGDTLSLHALIKEQEFSREFQTLNTVTVELSVFDPPESRIVALALYSETTRDTIESYAYLYSLIRRALRHLFR